MKKIHKQVAVICTFRTSKQKHFLTESPGGKSACVHGRECISVSRRGSTEISSHVHSFQDEDETTTNDAVFFFYRREVTKKNR